MLWGLRFFWGVVRVEVNGICSFSPPSKCMRPSFWSGELMMAFTCLGMGRLFALAFIIVLGFGLIHLNSFRFLNYVFNQLFFTLFHLIYLISLNF